MYVGRLQVFSVCVCCVFSPQRRCSFELLFSVSLLAVTSCCFNFPVVSAAFGSFCMFSIYIQIAYYLH